MQKGLTEKAFRRSLEPRAHNIFLHHRSQDFGMLRWRCKEPCRIRKPLGQKPNSKPNWCQMALVMHYLRALLSSINPKPSILSRNTGFPIPCPDHKPYTVESQWKNRVLSLSLCFCSLNQHIDVKGLLSARFWFMHLFLATFYVRLLLVCSLFVIEWSIKAGVTRVECSLLSDYGRVKLHTYTLWPPVALKSCRYLTLSPLLLCI